jgi:uncharacterized protein YecE (DUF72 family)
MTKNEPQPSRLFFEVFFKTLVMQKHVIRIGTSGWSYKHWINTFYPIEIKPKDHFQYYRQFFNTVEINNSFYRLPKKEIFANWEKEVPKDFTYVIKASRFITHMKKLIDPKQSIALFFEHIAFLKKKVGAILFQLPPNMKANFIRLEDFVKQLPKGYRYVFEFRNVDWYRDEIYQLLQKYNCAFCIYELNGHLSPIQVTADFVYLRLHGPGDKYRGSYSTAALKKWAKQCKEWLKSKDVFVYFDNDEEGYAAFNAIQLKALIEN